MSWKITFKDKSPMECKIVYSSIITAISEKDMIKKQEREILQIHFDAKTDSANLVAIFNNEDTLSEITIEDCENNKFWVYVGYVIPNSLSLIPVDGESRWVMEIAQLTEADKQLRRLTGIISKDLSVLPFDDYIKVRIEESKTKLSEFLYNNPLISKCRGGVAKKYSATVEKQNLFANKFLVHMVKQQFGDNNDTMTWNEAGDECVPWTDAEALQFMIDMDGYVTPLVKAQQSYEKKLLNCKTKAEADEIKIDYSTVETPNGAITEESNITTGE